ncbi:hypothetical protein [Streptomyces sp. SID5606]|uniref:hypothetical protein n=1 Tax=Streptomyces sp. SID5606 TaxID=2690305 RepID=UPI0013705A53|nr:hypothetical protein [Streptomyces sp. SID5606]MZD58724.1 hypothetical protein [Streptomyces sp. SID5606]
MGIADTSIAAVAALFSGGAAVAAWRASREANATAANVAQIERDRWHSELTPRLRMMITSRHPVMSKLVVHFEGPAAVLGPLSVPLRIRDDRNRSRDPELADGVTAAMRERVIWGPCRFRLGTDGADDVGRQVASFTVEADDKHLLALDLSAAPHWYEGEAGERRWREEYEHARVRLWAGCEAVGHKPWWLSFEVPRNGDWVENGPLPAA